MNLRPLMKIQTAMKAMTDVVLPAVDPNNKMAQEQARLVVGMLNLLAETLPLAYRYDLDELERSVQLANTLRQQTGGIASGAESFASLTASAEAGQDVLERARAEPVELENAVFDLRAKIGALITSTYGKADASLRHDLTAAVLTTVKEQLVRERVWVLSQGWEPDPASLPSIETLI
jgi:hypothetical protein